MSLESPNWFDSSDRELYEKLFYGTISREPTKIEIEFCKTMYHYEEYAAGLDGDFEEQE